MTCAARNTGRRTTIEQQGRRQSPYQETDMQPTVTADSRPHDSPFIDVDAMPGAAIAARMDRLPITRHLWMLVLLISLGGFFEVYDLIFTGYIAPGMAKSGVLQTTTHAFFGFTGIAGFIA